MSENDKIMKKLLVCSYIIIGLIILNTIILICKGNVTNSNTNSTTTTNDTTSYDVSMMESVDLDTMLNDVFKREDIQVIYMGRPTCSHCISFLPSLQQAQEELGYTTVYLDIETVDSSSDEFDEFIEKLDMEYTMGEETGTYGSFYGYTPAVFLYQNGKMIDGIIGELSYDELLAWLEENNVGNSK